MSFVKRIALRALMWAAFILPLGALAQVKDSAATQKTAAVKKAPLPQKPFAEYLKGLRREARAKGFSDALIDQALPDTLKPLHSVIQSDKKQPEKVSKVEDYARAVMSQKRVDSGFAKKEQFHDLLQRVSAKYGVEPEALLALWGIESNYGRNQGSISVTRALATMAWDGRRESFFKGELFQALRMIERGDASATTLKGSWAGAMGQVQFMPSSFFAYAQDFDGDGQRDIWSNTADVLASIANYLHQAGWKKGERWGDSVVLSKPVDSALMTLDKSYPLSFWKDKGITLKSGQAMDDLTRRASLIQPDGPGTPAYLVYNNFRVILSWNRSKHFGIAFGRLSDRFLSDRFKGP